MIAPTDIPRLPRGVRTRYDKVRQMDVLLGPERVLMLDQIGEAVLSRVDGAASFAQIVDDLATSFDAPRDMIEGDVQEYLSDLADKRLLDVTHG